MGNVSRERDIKLSSIVKHGRVLARNERRGAFRLARTARPRGTCNDDEYPLDDFGVTSSRLRGIRGRGERRGRMVTRALQPHPLHFSLLRFRELRRDYDQAEVDHEERADLQTRALFNPCTLNSFIIIHPAFRFIFLSQSLSLSSHGLYYNFTVPVDH